jgi:hypothetical protein
MENRIKGREKFAEELQKQKREIQRQKRFTGDTSMDAALALLIRSTQDFVERLDSHVRELKSMTATLPGSVRFISLGDGEAETSRKLLSEKIIRRNFDAIVMGCVLEDLQRNPSAGAIFPNKNSRDFDTPALKRMLEPHNCKLLPGFQEAVSHLTNERGIPL